MAALISFMAEYSILVTKPQKRQGFDAHIHRKLNIICTNLFSKLHFFFISSFQNKITDSFCRHLMIEIYYYIFSTHCACQCRPYMRISSAGKPQNCPPYFLSSNIICFFHLIGLLIEEANKSVRH